MGNVPGKKVVNADPGDADHFGGDDLDDIQDFLNNVDKTGPVKINTRQYFRSGKLELRNPADTFSYVNIASAILANRNVTYPLLTADDVYTFNAATQTLSNKTLDSSCIITSAAGGEKEYASVLFKSGSTYTAMKYDGTVISSGTTAETVIQAALNLKGSILFADNGPVSWTLSGGFTGFTVDRGTKILCPQNFNVNISVPNGYNGIVFKFIGTSGSLTETVGIAGLQITEAGTPARNWTGIKFEIAGTDSLSNSTFKDIVIYDAGVGIELETRNSRWIESCCFENIYTHVCRVGILFDQGAPDEIHTNRFTNIVLQASDNALCTNGFKDVNGKNNMFIGCDCWDFTSANTETNITSTAINTTIIGGLMCGAIGQFVDQGIRTLIVDSGNKNAQNRVITTADFAKYGNWDATTVTGASGLLDGVTAAIAVGTGTNSGRTLDSTGSYITYDTAATINSITGLRSNVSICRGDQNAYFKTAIYLNSVSNVRVFAGLLENTGAPVSAADPLNAVRGIALWFDSAVNANWRCLHNDNTGAGVSTDLSVAAATGTLYPVVIYCNNQSTRWRIVFNGVSTEFTTDVPISTANLAFWVYMENTTGASRTMRHYYVVARNDK